MCSHSPSKSASRADGENCSSLFGTFAEKNNFDRFKNNDHIQRNGKVLDVKEIKLELSFGIFHGGTVLILDLGPSSNSRAHSVALGKEIQAGFQHFAEVRLLRARPHQAHGAVQNVEELWQLVQAIFADERADAGNAIVAVSGPTGTAFFGVLPHGTELKDFKLVAVQSDTLLPEEHRAAALNQDRERNQGHDRQSQRDGDERSYDIHGAFSRQQELTLAKAIIEDEPTGRKPLQ